MAKLYISEMQFAFLYFHKFMLSLTRTPAMVEVPSTYREGRDDGSENDSYDYKGADLVIDQYFIQFKLAKHLKSKNKGKFAEDHSDSYFYYETHNSGKTNGDIGSRGQHDFLKGHCDSPQKKVWYVAPSFNNTLTIENWFDHFLTSTPDQLDDYSATLEVKHTNHWQWPDKKTKHHVSYTHADSWVYTHSEPKEFKKVKTRDLNKSYSKIEDLILDGKTIPLKEAIINILKSLSELEIEHNLGHTPTVEAIQKFLFLHLNIVWFPIVVDAKNVREIRLDHILNNIKYDL
jgi:hypothetical protein